MCFVPCIIFIFFSLYHFIKFYQFDGVTGFVCPPFFSIVWYFHKVFLLIFFFPCTILLAACSIIFASVSFYLCNDTHSLSLPISRSQFFFVLFIFFKLNRIKITKFYVVQNQTSSHTKIYWEIKKYGIIISICYIYQMYI